MTDGETIILTDPFFTRPSFWSVLFGRTLKSDPDLIKSFLEPYQKIKNKIVIISHTHYDHILDLKNLLLMWPDATVIGPKETPLFAPPTHSRFISADTMGPVGIGKFKIRSFPAVHAPLPLGIEFAKGERTSPLPSNPDAYDFLASRSFSFSIEHPQNKIIFHPGAYLKYSHKDFPFVPDTLFVGAQGRHKTKDYLKFLKEIGAAPQKTAIVPVHHDNFFKPLGKEFSVMPLFTYETLKKELNKTPYSFNLKVAPYKGEKPQDDQS